MRALAPITHQLLLTFPKFSLSFNNNLLLQLPLIRYSNFNKPPKLTLLNPTKTLISFFHCKATTTITSMADDKPQQLTVEVKDNIQLTDKESLIFNRLKDVLHHFELNTQLRVAGGWVRDKLLGKDCYDIDVAIDNMLGRELCEKINEYLSKNGEDVQGIGVIQCNPDQSKHLETARMRLFDLWIDFVNLRAEDYCENSRIPTMRFGTPEEDAYRRDLTINSLFYNINTDSVEDFTGRGLTDLKLGKIVTPLPPKETFLDDPLRVLRAIRFGARFNFVLDEGLKEAAASDEVRAAIAEKISRERIGHEVDLMIGGNEPGKAVTYICDLQLFWIVFGLPSNVEPSLPEACDRLCLAFMDRTWRLVHSLEDLILNDEHRRLCLYAGLFLPLRSMVYRDNKKKKIPAVDFIFRNSLKLKAKDPETVISIHRSTEKFIALISYITSEADVQHAEAHCGKILIDVPEASKLRILTGLLLREIKEFWPVALLVSTLIHPCGGLCESSEEDMKLEKSKELYQLVKDVVLKLDLENIWEAKPLVNGKDIMGILNLKAGPNVKEWQHKIVASISVGSKLPEATLSYLDASDEVKTVTISQLTASKKAILFAVPGAFTPTCSQKHVPGFVAKSSELKSKGVDIIACISVNDAFVMKAWKENLKISDDDGVLLLSDGNGDFTRAIGAELDLSDKPVGLGVRSKRYSMLVEDGVVKVLNMEDGGAFTTSGAEDMLKVL